MKKTLSLVALLAVCATAAFAQQPGTSPKGPGRPGGPGMMRGPGARMGKMNAEIYKQLGLTADQKKKVDALDKSHMAKMKALFDSASKGGERSAMRDKFMKLRDEHEKGLFAILSDAQEKKYKTLRKATMDKMRKERGGMRPGGPRQP